MTKSGVPKKYVKMVWDMYEYSKTVMKCAVRVGVGLHQGSDLHSFICNSDGQVHR